MKADKIIEKFALRSLCTVGGVLGQKMDEECIQQFLKGDPSGNCKYFEWMMFQAGGGKHKLDKSIKEWEKGAYGEECLRDQVKNAWFRDRINGYKDDDGNAIPPISKEEAEILWVKEEEKFRKQHIYGDEDFEQFGGFAFHRSWPGPNNFYEIIVKTVKRFHKHRDALKSSGKSIDLSVAEYPDLSDLIVALKDIVAAELKADLDYDVVYNDDHLVVVCPYNIGASLKFGHPKWCTANETMFLTALSGGGTNRWKEYASVSALYYCRFKHMAKNLTNHPVQYCAVEISHEQTQNIAKYWDAEDKACSLKEWLTKMTNSPLVALDHIASFKLACEAILRHYATYPRDRVVTAFTV